MTGAYYTEEAVTTASILFGMGLIYLAIKMFFPELLREKGVVYVESTDISCESCITPDRLTEDGCCLACGMKCAKISGE